MKEWWETAHTELNSECTRDEVMTALNKTIAITPETYALMENSSAVSYSGMVSSKFHLTRFTDLNLSMDYIYLTIMKCINVVHRPHQSSWQNTKN